jgi:putative transposase
VRAELLEPEHPDLSMRKQCTLMGVARSNLYYQAVPEKPEDLQIKRIMDELYLVDPCLGTRKIVTLLKTQYGIIANRKRVQRLRREMGLETIWSQPRTTIVDEASYKYPYLLRDKEITAPDEVWCCDITYLPMPQGSAYLCAVMDWHSRKVLGWEISNTMDTDMCLRALQKAIDTSNQLPEIFNTDQGSQFTSEKWVENLVDLDIQISMDGKGRWMDNVFIERLWRSLKYEDIYLYEYANMASLIEGVDKWFARYNSWRPHQALENHTPEMIYNREVTLENAAA